MAGTLAGSGLRRILGRSLASLDLPCDASFASSSAFSFGSKSECNGIQWSWRFMTLRIRPFQVLPALYAARFSPALIRLSWCECSCSALLWISSIKYWPGCEFWLFRALLSAWLSEPRMTKLRICTLRPFSKCRPIRSPTLSASYTVCLSSDPRWKCRVLVSWLPV